MSAGLRIIREVAAYLAPKAKPHPLNYAAMLRHLGGIGLFAVAVVDGSPLPTFGGPDILTAILAARHVEPWYWYAVIATTGSVLGAYLTYHAAHVAGAEYLKKKFGKRRVSKALKHFEEWGTAGLAISAAVPFPSPTSAFFAAAGVLKYPLRRFLVVVTLCRAVRYSVIAVVAFHYGRRFIRGLQHPGQHIGLIVGIAAAIAGAVVIFVLMRRRLALS